MARQREEREAAEAQKQWSWERGRPATHFRSWPLTGHFAETA
jgi:hypothetical protein